jgi:uncharacterized protein (DUF924 family)
VGATGTATTPTEVLDFWFGRPPSAQPRAEWFRKDPAFDELVRQRFGALLQRALDGQLSSWDTQPESALAHIVLLDQFTRNAFRDTPRAFAGDAQALALAQALVARGGDRQLLPLQRWFAYLPFEHAESRAVQLHSLQLFTELAREHPAMGDAQHWAVKHARSSSASAVTRTAMPCSDGGRPPKKRPSCANRARVSRLAGAGTPEGFASPQVTAGCSSRMVPASASISTSRPTGSVNLRLMWPNIAPL